MKLSEVNNGSSSHLAVLSEIANFIKVEEVLELGTGVLSTSLFLNTQYYPDLIILDSYENNEAYFNTMRGKFSDCRLFLELTNLSIADAVEPLSLVNYDLCLIDDSTTIEERSKTIQVVTAKCTDTILMVIHDFEHQAYINAVNPNLNVNSIKAILPHTALVWSKDSIVWSETKSKLLEEAIDDMASN